jgi:peptide/nickel transport system permease protein
VLLVMSFLIYALIGLMPGDPIDLMISSNPRMTSEDAARLRALYGLDLPIIERYWHWLSAALHGDFGYSRMQARPAMEVVLPALGNTALLLGISFVLSLALGLWLGVLAAVRPYSRTDHAVNLLAFAGISVPPFWLALLLIIVFAVMLGVLPAGGVPTADEPGVWERLRYAILPIVNLTLASVGGHTRFVRAAMIETLRQDFIRTARAKGIGPRRVVFKHALRHALIPVTTIVALNFGALFSGALITETIFAYPGMGKLIFDSIMNSDFNLALVALLFATLLTLIGNLLADLAYAALDPRIRYG